MSCTPNAEQFNTAHSTTKTKYDIQLKKVKTLRHEDVVGCTVAFRQGIRQKSNFRMVIKLRRLNWKGNVTRMKMKNARNNVVRIPEGKSPIGRPRCRVQYIKMNIKDVDTCQHGNAPPGGKLSSSQKLSPWNQNTSSARYTGSLR